LPLKLVALSDRPELFVEEHHGVSAPIVPAETALVDVHVAEVASVVNDGETTG
jgi:hypothetical protein